MSSLLNDAGYANFDGSNYNSFVTNFLEEARPLGALVTSLRKGVQFVRTMPTTEDCYLDANGAVTALRKYDLNTGGDLSAEAKKAFRDAYIKYSNDIESDLKLEAQLLTLLMKRCSPIVKSTLATHGTTYSEALDSNSYFTIWTLLKSSYATGNSAAILSNLTTLFNLKQGTDVHEVYLEKYYAATKLVVSDFTTESHLGYIKCDHLFGAIYLAGLNQEFFANKIESTYTKYPTGKIDDIHQLTKDFQSYNLQKILPTHHSQSSDIPSPDALCLTCRRPVPVAVGRIFKYCHSCSSAFLKSKTSTPSTHPPTQMVAATLPPPQDHPIQLLADDSMAASEWASGEEWEPNTSI
jgi:hypothetical protein